MERRLEDLLARAEEAYPAKRVGPRERMRRWMGREKLTSLPLRQKATVALATALLIDFWTLAGWGVGAGLGELFWTLVEAPALLLGLLAAPSFERGANWALQSFGAAAEPQTQLSDAAAQLETQKRSLYLRLSSPVSPLPEEEPDAVRSLPPRS
jgi:hypothetical protein